jgi:hypothetical protein
MATYATSFTKRGGYSFDERAIADLWNQAKSFVGDDANITVKLEGDHEIRLKEVNELFEDAFLRHNFIEQLSIYGSDFRAEPVKNISISLGYYVWVSISGDRQECAVKRTEIENILGGRRIWYSKLFAGGVVKWFLGGVIVSGIINFVAERIRRRVGLDDSFLSATIIALPLIVLVVLLFATAKDRMFPRLVFELGKSAQVGKRAEYWRNAVGIGVVLAFVVGIAVDAFVGLSK